MELQGQNNNSQVNMWRESLDSIQNKLKTLMQQKVQSVKLQPDAEYVDRAASLANSLKSTDQINSYEDIILYKLQGSLSDLTIICSQLASEFGKSHEFWMNLVPKLAQRKMSKEDGIKTVRWEIKDIDKLARYIDPQVLKNNRKLINFHQKAVLLLNKLTNKIQSAQNSEDCVKITQLYLNSEKAIEAYQKASGKVQKPKKIKFSKKKQIIQQNKQEQAVIDEALRNLQPKPKKRKKNQQKSQAQVINVDQINLQDTPKKKKKSQLKQRSTQIIQKQIRAQQKKQIKKSPNLLNFFKIRQAKIAQVIDQVQTKPQSTQPDKNKNFFSLGKKPSFFNLSNQKFSQFERTLSKLQSNIIQQVQLCKFQKPQQHQNSFKNVHLYFERIFKRNLKRTSAFLKYRTRPLQQFDQNLDYDKGFQTQIQEMQAQSIDNSVQGQQNQQQEGAQESQSGFVVQDGYLSQDQQFRQQQSQSECSVQPGCQLIHGQWKFQRNQQFDLKIKLSMLVLEESPIDPNPPQDKKELQFQVKKNLTYLFLGSKESISNLLQKAKSKYPQLPRSGVLNFLKQNFNKGPKKTKIMDQSVFLQYGTSEQYKRLIKERQLQYQQMQKRRREQKQLNRQTNQNLLIV